LAYTHAELSAVNGVRRAERQKDYVVKELTDPRSFYSVGLTIFEPSAIAQWASQAFATWLLHGDLLDTASNFFSGFGDFLTLGGTAQVREWAGTDHFIDRNSFAYSAGAITGMVVQTIITSGAGQACGTATWAIQLARGYSMVVNIHALGTSLYHVYTGQATWSDLLTIGLTTVAGLKYLRGGCFVGETLVVLDDGRQVAIVGEIIADAGTSSQAYTALTIGATFIIIGAGIVYSTKRRQVRDLETIDAAIEELLDETEYPDNDDEDDSMRDVFDNPVDQLFAEANDFQAEASWQPDHDEPASEQIGTRLPTAGSAPATAIVAAPQVARRRKPATNPAKTRAAKPTNFFRWLTAGLFLLLGLASAGYGLLSLSSPAPKVVSVPPAPKYKTQAIRDIEVGTWVLARNPEISDEEREQFDEVDPDSWSRVTLVMEKEDESLLFIDMLRPTAWVTDQAAEVGSLIDIDLEEMGATGKAEVLAIRPCPILSPRPSRQHHLVTATFAHSAGDICDLHIVGQDSPITCTPNHLFWSIEGESFIPAVGLAPGQHLLLADGSHAEVSQIQMRPDGDFVYNLEVNGEHVYFVSDLGVLVHNQYFSHSKYYVYIAKENGKTIYVGITRNLPLREAQHLLVGRTIEAIPMGRVGYRQARALEHELIKKYKIVKDGGTLQQTQRGIAQRSMHKYTDEHFAWAKQMIKKYGL
jgi:hypothetical protein